jgi:hypothetical protein
VQQLVAVQECWQGCFVGSWEVQQQITLLQTNNQEPTC